ncbi:hypothetical protein WISP_48287 [Willisornis vidua]|uniref:Uncharacterized protein n=1 Tax=Willisornis vidua TaxID=1566151 RepID=A0ABQ9DJP6_9PASS|nr:hypothetical protein WISP_48287 [Willisornis vidua]
MPFIPLGSFLGCSTEDEEGEKNLHQNGTEMARSHVAMMRSITWVDVQLEKGVFARVLFKNRPWLSLKQPL